MKAGILIQARMSSSRLHKKMMMNIGEYKLVEFVYKRCLLSNMSEFSAVITSEEKDDDELYDFCTQKGIPVFRGSLTHVLHRYISAADYFNIDTIVRVCGDSPFVDTETMDLMIKTYYDNDLDYVHLDKNTIVHGLDCEIVKKEVLRGLLKQQLSRSNKEHVTTFIKDNLHKYNYKLIKSTFSPEEVAKIRFTVDYKKDLDLCRFFYEKHFKCIDFSAHDVTEAVRAEVLCVE